MTRQPRHDDRAAGGRDSRSLVVAGAAAGIVLAVIAGWAVVGKGTGAAQDAPTSTARPVAATDDELLHRASERLIARCMDRHGFAYAEQPPPSTTTGPNFRYAIDDVAWARKNGYGPLLGRPGSWERDANFGNLRKLTPARQRAWQRTLQGSGRGLVVDLPDLGRISAPGNGCTAEAGRTLYGDLVGWYRVRRIADHVGSYVAGQVAGASGYRVGLAAWATCVRKRGYAASSPRELRELIARQAPESGGERPAPESGGGQARTREIAAAVTEAECAVSSGFSQTIGALERRYRPEIERRFARELEALKSFERGALPRARKTLADA